MFKRRKYRAERENKAWFFLLPALVIIGIFNVYPLIQSFILSFQSGRIRNREFSGFKNYGIVLQDPKFHTALSNTFIYALIVVPVCLVISLWIAWIIFEKVKFKSVFETIFFIPYLTSTLAIGVVFRLLFNKSYGFINYLLSFIGVGPIDFLDNVHNSIPTLIIFGIWTGLAFNIIILLSGLRNINEDYYKVADMFGATKREQFFKITLPQLLPILTFLIIVNFISALKIYTQVFALFNGKAGIANSAMTAVFYIYDTFYVKNQYGVAMAATVILFVIILLFTLIQNFVLDKIKK